jgi:hypothetical protein
MNENIKYDCNKNMIILNRLSISKNKEDINKINYLQKNIKSISGKNILLSPKVIKENNKKMNMQRNNKNKEYFIQNYLETKKQNNLNNLLKNTNTSFPNLRRSVKNDNNTGYKIKNLNINYFNIIQPNELFFNPKSSRSNSKRQKNNKSKFIIFNNNNNNLNNSSNFIFESKINNALMQKNKIKIENKNLLKNSLYLITDYNYNTKKNNNTCQKIRTYNIHQHNVSYSSSSFSPNKFGGTSIIYMSKDKNGKKLIKRKMYNKDITSFNYNNNELKKKGSNNNIIKNNNFKNYNMQISFIKIPKKINNIKRDISTGRKVSNNKNK